MNVTQLIEKLSKMPPNADVGHLWDGEVRTIVQHVWLSNGGYVVTSDHGQVCYSQRSRPIDAPSQKENPYWSTPEVSEEEMEYI
jgi:hypothetical protein